MDLVQALDIESDGRREAPLVLAKTALFAQRREVETVEGRLAHAPCACGESMRELRPSERFGDQEGDRFSHGVSWYPS
jgi:hypothetical protein